MSIEKVREHINQMKDHDLAVLKKLSAQPSISAQGVGIRECALLLKDIMEGMGIETALLETSGHPVVFGEVRASDPNAHTVLFYGHYDVQPAEPLELWKTPPFEPTVINGRLYGRGTADNKAQLLAHLFAVRSYLETVGSLPIHVKFVFEGEEESGSPWMSEFIEKHRDKLAADLVYISDGGMHSSGAPFIFYGARGMLQVELNLETATQDNHSGNKGGVIPNAAWEMVKVLAAMVDGEGKVLVPGFYDQVLAPSEYDLKLIDEAPYDPQDLAPIFGVFEIPLGKQEFYYRLMFQPTLTINGLVSGYTGAGGKTIIPGSAMAKLDMRLVADQDPDEIFDKIKSFVQEINPKVKVSKRSGMLPSRTRTDLPICRLIVDAAREAYGQEPVVMPLLGATMPDFVWTKVLKLPSVTVPYANADENNHAPNENMDLECFYKGIHCSAQVIHAVGNLKK